MSKVFISTSCVSNDHIIDSVGTLSSMTKYIELSGDSSFKSDSLELLKAAITESVPELITARLFSSAKS